jgi:3-oxoadipate enol-lactonase
MGRADKIRAMIRATPVNGFIGCAAALAAHDYASAVASVKCPTLFIVGEKDGATPIAMAKLHEKLPESRFVALPGAGHISNMDRPAEFNRVLREFLTGG